MFGRNHIVNLEHLEQVKTSFKSFQVAGQACLDELKQPQVYTRGVEIIDKYRNESRVYTSYPSTPPWEDGLSEIVSWRGELQKIIDRIDSVVIPSFSSYDQAMATFLVEQRTQYNNYSRMLDAYIDAIGAGGVNIGSGQMVATIASIRDNHIQQVAMLKAQYQKRALAELLTRAEALKAEGKQLSDAEIEAIMQKHFGKSLTAEEYQQFKAAVIAVIPIKVQRTDDELEYMYELYLKSFGSYVAVGQAPPLSKEEFFRRNREKWVSGLEESLTSEFKLATYKMSENDVSTELTAGGLSLKKNTDYAEYTLGELEVFNAQLGAEIYAVKGNMAIGADEELRVSSTLMYATATLGGKVTADGVELGFNALAGVAKGEVSYTIDELPSIYITVTASVHMGAVGHKMEVKITQDDGISVDAGAAAGIGGGVAVNANLKKNKPIDWNSSQ